ncbi:MAG: sugar phosphate isomerase/epimerase family protein [Eubacteriales bacterium]
MSINVGVFLALEPYTSMERQLQLAKEAGFAHADITDVHEGASMFDSAGLAATVSVDGDPFETKRLFAKYGITPSTVCVHGALLEPSNPGTFQTSAIMAGIKYAAAIGIRDCVTTENEPHSEWAKKLTYEQRIFTIAEKLYVPCRMAADYGVNLLLEPHGPITDSIKGIQDIMDMLGNPTSLGVNMDTGNSWLGGTDPVEMAKVFKDKIYHIHWKDLGEEWVERRGKQFGCGFSTIAVGKGVIDIKGVVDVLKDRKEIHYSTLEVAGSAAVLQESVAYLRSCGL